MLKFTEEQSRHVLSSRAQFNTQQTMLANAYGSGSLIGNALPLPKDMWGMWDHEGIAIQRSTLGVFNDLAASVATPMPIGKLVAYFQTISDSSQANVTLDGRNDGRTDKPTFNYNGTPLPITNSPFSYGWREVEAARSEGFQLDSAGRDNAMRKVAEKLESIVLSGDANIVVGGAALVGLRTAPQRNTRATGVTLNAATGAQWLSEFTATLKLLHADNFKTPATIYVNWSDWFYATSTEFTTGYPKTIAQRVLELGGIKEIIPVDSINANEIIAIIKDKRTVQLLNGMPMSTLPQFRANPQDEYNFLTMAAAALQIRFDAEGKCGIAHSS